MAKSTAAVWSVCSRSSRVHHDGRAISGQPEALLPIPRGVLAAHGPVEEAGEIVRIADGRERKANLHRVPRPAIPVAAGAPVLGIELGRRDDGTQVRVNHQVEGEQAAVVGLGEIGRERRRGGSREVLGIGRARPCEDGVPSLLHQLAQRLQRPGFAIIRGEHEGVRVAFARFEAEVPTGRVIHRADFVFEPPQVPLLHLSLGRIAAALRGAAAGEIVQPVAAQREGEMPPVNGPLLRLRCAREWRSSRATRRAETRGTERASPRSTRGPSFTASKWRTRPGRSGTTRSVMRRVRPVGS